MLGGLVRHDSCSCSSVSAPVREALCWEGGLGTIPAAVRVFWNRSSQLVSAMSRCGTSFVFRGR